MKSRIDLSVVAVSLLAALTLSAVLRAHEPADHREGSERPRIITFDAPGAGKGPGPTSPPCFGACPGTVAVNANAEGAVVGYYVDDSNLFHGFVRCPDGHIETFDAPGAGSIPGSGQGTVAYSINAEGAIAGQFQDEKYRYHGFLRSPRGKFTTFDIPGVSGANLGPIGSANINDEGEIAGFYVDGNNVNHGFLRRPNGKIETFDVPQASTLSNFAPQGTVVALESGLNDEGAITGWYFDSAQAVHGYVRNPDGTFTLFDSLDGGTGAFQGTYGGSINDEGVITGGILNANYVSEGFIRFPNGKMETFQAPGAAAGQGTFGVGINAFGVITAYYTDSAGVTHGSVRCPDGKITTFDVQGAGTNPNQGTTPQGINRKGAIPGYYTDANNVNHAFLRLAQE
jgi:hypothetical protein